MNFVALLAVLAATAFTLPLLVQGGEALGLARGVSVAASLVLALALALLFAARTALGALRRRAVRAGGTGVGRRGRAAARPSNSGAVGAPRSTGGGLVDAQPQGLGGGLRLIDAEEESRAGL